ncbi:hypothetical protein [Sulfurivirga caldicuralii]|nr:hypothetical protein [Sulfurivirga caldicuralii]
MVWLNTLAQAQGKTLVVVSHDERIFSFADRLVHMEDGQIVKVERAK